LFDIPHFCSPLFFGGLVHTLELFFFCAHGLASSLGDGRARWAGG
jgi:hypothetical protein